jgi:hypothetical protein
MRGENIMEQIEIDRKIYNLGKRFLLNFKKEGITQKVLDKHINPQFKEKPKHISEIYLRFLESAQNAGMKPKVIGGAIGGVEKLQSVLFNFEPNKVLGKYGDDGKKLLHDIEARLKPRGKVRKTKKGQWPKYCRTILSVAEFLIQFKSAAYFFKWIDFFDKDEKSRVALPMMLDKEIDGIGFALACDFLKELGYKNFSKPDVHLRYIFTKLGLYSKNKPDDYQLFKAINRVAKNNNVSSYNADKLFWLIGSGNFYDVKPEISIGRNRKKFVEFARRQLSAKQ